MPGIDDVSSEFNDFIDYMRRKRLTQLDGLSKVVNGIEGWIKVEFYLWLTTARPSGRLAPTVADTEGDAGMEYKVALDRGAQGMDRERKQCDLWIRSSADSSRYHYVELKCVFSQWNTPKMLRSAGDDLWYMRNLDPGPDASPASGSAIVLGVGFADQAAWDGAKELVLRHAGLPEDVVRKPDGRITDDGALRWMSFTHRF